MQVNQQEVHVPATLDVEAVEHELAELWKHAGASEEDEAGATMRARVLNLIVYVETAQALAQINEVIAEITGAHPCRALVLIAERQAADHDIEMFISAFCQTPDARSERRLCCEQVTLKAAGRFVRELPSAATPLLVSDLPIFLWWRAAFETGDPVFKSLTRAADRLVIDSAVFSRPREDLTALVHLLPEARKTRTAVSDFNWSRLTSWRALLASFYDVAEYRAALDRLERVRFEYVAAEAAPQAIAPQALMLAGWLASRLGWSVKQTLARDRDEETHAVLLKKDSTSIVFEFRRIERQEFKPGRLARVELKSEAEPAASFVVKRSDDGLHLETSASGCAEVYSSRVVPVRNRSAAVLLGRELSIVSRDRVYEQAIASAAELLGETSDASPSNS
jgi:glucose-6-phosphate dehydrogenase assembly protein OpcA